MTQTFSSFCISFYLRKEGKKRKIGRDPNFHHCMKDKQYKLCEIFYQVQRLFAVGFVRFFLNEFFPFASPSFKFLPATYCKLFKNILFVITYSQVIFRMINHGLSKNSNATRRPFDEILRQVRAHVEGTEFPMCTLRRL